MTMKKYKMYVVNSKTQEITMFYTDDIKELYHYTVVFMYDTTTKEVIVDNGELFLVDPAIYEDC